MRDANHTASVHPAIQHSDSLIRWLDSTINGVEVQANDRVRIASACLDLAMEHHKAVVLLAGNQVFGSAFALIRVMFEAYVRGVWIHRCATDQEIVRFASGELPCFAELLRGVEAIEGFEDRVLSAAKQKSWKKMNDFMHSGHNHAMRRNKDTTIESAYSKQEILEVLGFANAIGLLSAFEIARLAESEKLVEDILAKSMEFWGAKA